MTGKMKKVGNCIFISIVFLLTIYYVFHGEDLGGVLSNLKTADARYWLLGVIFVVLFICCESLIIYYMMHSIKQKVNPWHCMLYSFVGFFFSSVTPSASGGQPMQLYFMRKDEIPISVSTLVLMIVTITYKFVLVVIGIGVFIIRPTTIMSYLQPVLGWCYLGIVLNVLCVAMMLQFVFHPTFAENVVNGMFRVIDHFVTFKREKGWKNRIQKAMNKYRDVAGYFAVHKRLIFNVFVITLLQRFLLFGVTWIVWKSFHISAGNVVTVIMLQAMISVAVDMLPLPGGMGITEKLFLTIFAPLCGQKVVLPVMVASRGISYYTQLLISAVLTIVAYVVIGRRKEKNNDWIL